MKRVGNLMPLIADMENLREAFLLAVKGKSMRPETIRFRDHLDGNLLFLHRQLLDGSYRPPAYRRFTVWDPKERTICAAPFHERVVQHAMMRVCHRLFDDFQMSHSFASRLRLGTYKAIEHAQHCSRSNKWFLKLDVTKYFDSIDHEVLYGQLSRIVKDRLLLLYWQQLLDSYETHPGKGLPIGNLTSQYWANHYLAVADHKAKEQLHTGKMARYMDDVVMWGNDRQELLRQGRLYEEMVRDELRLELHPFCLNRTEHGMPFLGYVVYPDRLRLSQRSRHRYRRKALLLEQLAAMGCIPQQQCRVSMEAMLAFVKKADCDAFLRTAHFRGAPTA